MEPTLLFGEFFFERGSSVSLDAHLYIKKESDKGYCFLLSFHPLRTPELVKGFVHMRTLGIPVEIFDGKNLSKLLRCEDSIDIIEERGDIIHRSGDMFDRRHLPHKSANFVRKIIWEPIGYNKKFTAKR